MMRMWTLLFLFHHSKPHIPSFSILEESKVTRLCNWREKIKGLSLVLASRSSCWSRIDVRWVKQHCCYGMSHIVGSFWIVPRYDWNNVCNFVETYPKPCTCNTWLVRCIHPTSCCALKQLIPIASMSRLLPMSYSYRSLKRTGYQVMKSHWWQLSLTWMGCGHFVQLCRCKGKFGCSTICAMIILALIGGG